MIKRRIRFGRRFNSRQCKIEEILLPNNLLDYFQNCISINDLENNCTLGIKEWNIILNKIDLSERERQCLYKYYWCGMKQDKISEQLKLTREAVSIYLDRARKKIAKHYKINIDSLDTLREEVMKWRSNNAK